MSTNPQTQSPTEQKPVPASRGLAFMLGCLGLFYGLITVVDPLL